MSQAMVVLGMSNFRVDQWNCRILVITLKGPQVVINFCHVPWVYNNFLLDSLGLFIILQSTFSLYNSEYHVSWSTIHLRGAGGWLLKTCSVLLSTKLQVAMNKCIPCCLNLELCRSSTVDIIRKLLSRKLSIILVG